MDKAVDPIALAGTSIGIFALAMTILAIFPALSQNLNHAKGVMTLLEARRLRRFSLLVGSAAFLADLATVASLVAYICLNSDRVLAWIVGLAGVLSAVFLALTIPLLVQYASEDASR